MKEYTIDKIRNVGVVGHGTVGKTSLVEAMLFAGKVVSRLGSIDSGNTISDYTEDEIERKISISTALGHLDYKGTKINLIDMPGYADFYGEVVGGLRAADTALIVINGVAGVEVGTDEVWRTAKSYDMPRAFFINRMDKENADFIKSLKDIQANFSNHAVPMVIAWGDGLEFKGIIDLVKMKALKFDKDGNASAEDIPSDLADVAREWHEKLVEAAAESDEALMEKFFDKGELSNDELLDGLAKGMSDRSVFPVFGGSATSVAGVITLIEYIAKLFPAPDYKGEITALKDDKEIGLKISPNEKASVLIFKTVAEQHVGDLSFFKVMSGKINSGDDLNNVNRRETERIGAIYFLNGKERVEGSSISAGDIGGLVKLKNSHTGDTLVAKGLDIQLPKIGFPRPSIQLAVKAKSKGDEDKIASGLVKLREEDPTIAVTFDAELKQTLLEGQGELHLDIVMTRLRRKFGVEAELGKPRIPYESSIRKKIEVQGKYKRQTGGRGQYGDCWLRLEPLARGDDFEFVNAIVGGVIPSKYLPAVEKGIQEARINGGLAGTRVVDFRVTCFDGSYHSVDSSDMAFKIAASLGFKSGFEQADPYLLEPIYNVTIRIPEDYMGDVMGDVSSRRGKIMGMDPDGNMQVIRAQIPQAEMYRYSTSLRSLTQGRGSHTREFSHYEEVPREISEKVIAEIERERKEAEEK